MPKFPNKEINEFSMDSPLDASKNGGYAPFSMKAKNMSGLMKKNYGTPAKDYSIEKGSHDHPHPPTKQLKNPIAGASPMAKDYEPTIRELKRTLRKGKYVKGPRKGDELSDRDRIDVEEQLQDLINKRTADRDKGKGSYGKEELGGGAPKRGVLKHGARLTPTKHGQGRKGHSN